MVIGTAEDTEWLFRLVINGSAIRMSFVFYIIVKKDQVLSCNTISIASKIYKITIMTTKIMFRIKTEILKDRLFISNIYLILIKKICLTTVMLFNILFVRLTL